MKIRKYQGQIEQYKKLVEQYKSDAKKAINKYIDSQAIKLGVSSSEIKNRLNESYTFEDVDAVCESLFDYKSSMNKLPFNLSKGNRVKITEQLDPIV